MNDSKRDTMPKKPTDTIKDDQRRIAFLVDGDNARPAIIEYMVREAEKYGTITIKRIFGDWTTQNMSGWKDKLHTFAIQPMQQFRYTTGKNATDSALIIDAMDILHTEQVDGFCIVSSDSDFTRLATRIREEGVFVMGVGEKKTPPAFVKACDVFVYTENLVPQKKKQAPQSPGKVPGPSIPRSSEKKLLGLLREAYNMVVTEEDWAYLSTIGTALNKIDPGFDPRTYGFRQLRPLLESLPRHFETKFLDKDNQTTIIVHMRD